MCALQFPAEGSVDLHTRSATVLRLENTPFHIRYSHKNIISSIHIGLVIQSHFGFQHRQLYSRSIQNISFDADVGVHCGVLSCECLF